jgi:tetratricopeptide (TPR) repeat protein
MMSPNIDPNGEAGDTIPTRPGPVGASASQAMSAVMPESKFRKRTVILFGILFVLIAAGIASWFGYQSGVNSRLQNQAGQVAMQAATQFQLGLQDQAAGRLDVAQQRFEYVIQLDSNFPGAQQKLAEVLMARQISLIPTEVPTPTLTPTVDTRGEQDLFAQIVQFLKDSKWTNAITTINGLRARNLAYRTVDVDGLYYIALRGEGVVKITNGDLEGGIYDLTLVERFGPLDNFAAGLRTWARYYLNGASFWDVDWEKVLAYFSDVYAAVPNLRDGSGMTASERYRIALFKYGDQIAASGDYCKAQKYYKQSLAIGNSPTVAPKATEAAHNCEGDTATPRPQNNTPTTTLTPTITGTGLIFSPTVPGATVTPTPPQTQPTVTPTPTVAPPTPTTGVTIAPSQTPVPPTPTNIPPTATK